MCVWRVRGATRNSKFAFHSRFPRLPSLFPLGVCSEQSSSKNVNISTTDRSHGGLAEKRGDETTETAATEVRPRLFSWKPEWGSLVFRKLVFGDWEKGIPETTPNIEKLRNRTEKWPRLMPQQLFGPISKLVDVGSVSKIPFPNLQNKVFAKPENHMK